MYEKDYVKCENPECGKILDIYTEAIEHNGKFYCMWCYDDIIAEEQNEELDELE